MTLPSDEPRQEPPAGTIDRGEKRKRLRIFQSELVERMQAAREQTDVRDNQLGVIIGQRHWLLSLQETGEVVPVTAITKVPLTQDWYLGLLNIRGNLISVIDFARYQGLAPTEIEAATRIVTFAPALGINCGLVVSRVLGLRNVTEMQLQSEAAADQVAWAGNIYRDNDSQEWTALSLSAIAQEQRFLHIGL
jgi:twitching motility protein PilI